MKILGALNTIYAALQNTTNTQATASTQASNFTQEAAEVACASQTSETSANTQFPELSAADFKKHLNPAHLQKKLELLQALKQTVQNNGGSVTVEQARSLIKPPTQNINQGTNFSQNSTIQPPQAQQGGPKGDPLQKLDANRDGNITLEEIQAEETKLTNLLSQQQLTSSTQLNTIG